MEPIHGPARFIREFIGDGNRLAEMCDCLGIRRAFQRVLAGLAPPLEGHRVQPRFSEVICQDFRLGPGDDRKLVAQDFANVLMEQLPAALEQALVGRFLNERMLEAIAHFRRRSTTQ